MVLLWAIFGVELAALVVVGVQRSLADRRGGQSWLIAALTPAIAAATEVGEARQAEHPELPLDEPSIRRRIHHLVTACGLVLSVPGLSAVALSQLPSETLLLAFALATLVGMDVAILVAVIVATWRGWLPLPDDDDDGGGGDEDPELAPMPGGPWTRAHLFNLLR
ncbi:MAG: hypothetical protein QOD24_3387 [Solirubrobacteraceae bacterium]|nr:hypothetical protein [Solirubrobacteraceae bacterium]